MAEVGIITFHGSHNFGSMLQAYALQQVLKKLGFASEIINFRSEIQKNIYARPLARPASSLKQIIRKIILLPHNKALNVKYDKFEEFIKDNLVCTKEYSSPEDLQKNPPSFKFYICGSDQIWNFNCADFNDVYFLTFVKEGIKAAYAPSMGPRPAAFDCGKIKNYLEDFNALSVREPDAADIIEKATDKKPFIALDPVLLLSAEEWRKLFDQNPLVNGKYIYLYAPAYKKNLIKKAKEISSRLKLPTVLSNPVGYSTLYFGGFIRKFDCGPKEFLNLIYYAQAVVSGSFHAAAFASLFGKKLFCPNGENDARISRLLNIMPKLEEHKAASLHFLAEVLK